MLKFHANKAGMGTAPQAEYDSLQINKIEGRWKDNGTFLHFHEAPGTFIGKVCYESFIITLFFDLSSLHMQPGIIAGDEVKYNHRYVTFPASVQLCRCWYFDLFCNVNLCRYDFIGCGAFAVKWMSIKVVNNSALCICDVFVCMIVLSVEPWCEPVMWSSASLIVECVFLSSWVTLLAFSQIHFFAKMTISVRFRNTEAQAHGWALTHSMYCKLRLTLLHKSL